MQPANIDLIKLAIYALSSIFVVGFLAFTIVGGIAFSKTTKGAAKSFGLLFQRGNFLRIATVMFVVLAVIFLSLLGGLNEGAVSVLSGVAGYVLGGLDRQQQDSDKNDDE